MALQAGFDLGRGDVLPTDLQHVLDAAVEHHRSAAIHRADVAGVVPAITIERLRGFLGILVIAEQRGIAAHPHFAALARRGLLARRRIDDAHFEARQRTAEPRDALIERIVQAARGHGAGRFGHAESTDVDRVRHCLQHRVLDGRRLHCEIGVHQCDARKIRSREVGVIDQILHDRDEARICGRHAILLQHRKRGARLEVFHRRVGTADVEDRAQRQDRGDVENRQRRPEYVVVGQRIAMPSQRDRIAHDGLVRDQCAFRIRGGARRIEHDRGIAELHAQARFMHTRIRAEPRQRGEFRRRQEPGRCAIAEQNQTAQLRRGIDVQPTGIRLTLEPRQRLGQPLDEVHVIGDLARRDHGDQVTVGDRVGEFAVLVARVQRDGHGAAQRNREQEFDELGAGRQQQADVITRLHAERLERARPGEGPVRQLPVRQTLVRQDQRRRIGVAIGGNQQQITEGGDLDADLGQILAVQISFVAQGKRLTRADRGTRAPRCHRGRL